MALFYPFGIPTTSSYAMTSSRTQLVNGPRANVPDWALYGQSGPKGPPGTPAVQCPSGYINASIENTITYSGSRGVITESFPPVPYKYARVSVDPSNNRNNHYVVCYPIPTPTPQPGIAGSVIALSALTQSVTASTEIVPGASIDASVQVRNIYDNPLGFPIAVSWSILSPGSGSLQSSSNFTDEYSNSAVTAWIVGSYTGSQWIQALVNSGSLASSPVRFNANVVPSSSWHTHTTASLSAGNVIAGNTVTMTLIVRDQFGNLLTGMGTVSPLLLSPSNEHFTVTGQNGTTVGNFSCTSGVCTATVTPNNTAGGRIAVTTAVKGQAIGTGAF